MTLLSRAHPRVNSTGQCKEKVMFNSKRTCTCCGNDHSRGQWWSLKNYYGFTGLYCGQCYDLVKHDAFDRPVNPQGLVLARLRVG